MNNKEFLDVQNTVIEKVFELENIKRREYFAQYKYMTIFSEYILEQAKLKYENIYMLEGIKAKSENQEYDVASKKEELEAKMVGFKRHQDMAKQVLDIYDKYSVEKLEELENIYKEFVTKYHPAINVKSSKEQVQVYQMLTSVYLVGEVEQFVSMYNELKDNLEELVIEDDLEQIINVYNQTIENLTNLIEKRKESLPFKYEDIINDESKITSELSRFREAIYELRNINKNLRLDWQLNYNNEF